MSDVLIRDVPDDVLAAIDAHAARLGLSRSEYLRRRLAQDVASSRLRVAVADLDAFSRAFADLAEPEVMRQAWS
jgi:plasmid stability protein